MKASLLLVMIVDDSAPLTQTKTVAYDEDSNYLGSRPRTESCNFFFLNGHASHRLILYMEEKLRYWLFCSAPLRVTKRLVLRSGN